MGELTVRRSQIITPFGPGSIVEQKGGSFCVSTSDIWNPEGGIEITEFRLQRLLRKNHFKTPSPISDFGSSPTFARMVRFPRWHFCKLCRKMVYLKKPVQKIEHKNCGGVLVPMRFVMICENGHMSDVPWERWVHGSTRCENYSLSFLSDKKTGGLDSLKIKCNTCGKERNLKGIMSKNSLASAAAKCSGGQPWDDEPPFDCDKSPLVVQKGASNVLFPILVSAVDIPPYSKSSFRNQLVLQVEGDPSFTILITIIKNNFAIDDLFINPAFSIIANNICSTYKITNQDLKNILEDYLNEKKSYSEVEDISSLKEGEYKSFIKKDIDFDPEDNLIFRNMHDEITIYKKEVNDKKLIEIINSCSKIIENIIKVDKLRIVTVFKGFFRQRLPKLDIFENDGLEHDPDEDTLRPVSADRGTGRPWLPAIENYGEGIFLTFKEDYIQSYINLNENISKRAQKIGVPPKYLLLHTLSHTLIRQLAFECGYPAASIAERIYCDDGKDDGIKMSGILIYTYGDSHGSLGGLARQAKPDRFFSLIYNAMNSINWCSNDPLCIESEGQGLMNSNLAACHSCVLLPETSCEIYNRFLDRGLLIGIEEPKIEGLFQSLINL